MSNLKENLLKVIDSALELAAECEQTIEVRGAIKQLKQAHGSISMHNENTVMESEENKELANQASKKSNLNISEVDKSMDPLVNDDNSFKPSPDESLPEGELKQESLKSIDTDQA